MVNNVIDYDAESKSEGAKSIYVQKTLWTKKDYEDFILLIDWRIKATPWSNHNVPIVLPSGLHKLNNIGEEIKIIVPDSDSGVWFRGQNSKALANIWCWPIGSGEVYDYRMDQKMSPEVRRAVTPRVNADRNIGE